jgi:hypothetical protein
MTIWGPYIWTISKTIKIPDNSGGIWPIPDLAVVESPQMRRATEARSGHTAEGCRKAQPERKTNSMGGDHKNM